MQCGPVNPGPCAKRPGAGDARFRVSPPSALKRTVPRLMHSLSNTLAVLSSPAFAGVVSHRLVSQSFSPPLWDTQTTGFRDTGELGSKKGAVVTYALIACTRGTADARRPSACKHCMTPKYIGSVFFEKDKYCVSCVSSQSPCREAPRHGQISQLVDLYRLKL